MSAFVSYAQNFEDVMLWRALNHIEQGFYIDVGAWSPDIDSVTRAFYEKGWSGINIEPNPEFYKQLVESRQRDINLKLAIGEAEGIATMNFVANPGLSTLDDNIAQQHKNSGWDIYRREVEVKTLATIWLHNVPEKQPVHFLKIDVEGAEEAVLLGNDWTLYRPWILVVESTLPMSQVESYESWEHILIEAGYHFVYADGLNRFYVAKEHSDLISKFKYPPNVFDEFVLASSLMPEKSADESKEVTYHKTEDIYKLTQRIEALSWKLFEAERKSQTLQQQINWIFVLAVTEHKNSEQLHSRLAEKEQALEVIQSVLESSLAHNSEDLINEISALREQIDTQNQLFIQVVEKIKSYQVRLDEALEKAACEYERAEKLMLKLAKKEQALQSKKIEVYQLNYQNMQLKKEYDISNEKIKELNHSAHHWWVVSENLSRELQSIYESKSWRITFPLRKAMGILRFIIRLTKRGAYDFVQLLKRGSKAILVCVIKFTLSHKLVNKRVKKLLSRFPKAFTYLRSFAIAHGVIKTSELGQAKLENKKNYAKNCGVELLQELKDQEEDYLSEATLTPRARQIYIDLKAVIRQPE